MRSRGNSVRRPSDIKETAPSVTKVRRTRQSVRRTKSRRSKILQLNQEMQRKSRGRVSILYIFNKLLTITPTNHMVR